MERFEPLVRELIQTEEGLDLLTMLVDDHYQQMLHAVPDQPAASEAATARQPRRTGGRRGRPRR